MESTGARGGGHVHCFGRFELRTATHELLRNGERVDVQPKVFDLIAYLLAHRDRVVDKNELQDAVWPRQIVTEAALSRAVMKARRALDDDADAPRHIRTVHGRGYRFVAAVESTVDSGSATAAAEQTAADAVPAAPAGQRAWQAFWWATVLPILAMLGVAAAVWLRDAELPASRGRNAAEATPERVRIAALPVVNATGDDDLDWMRLGLLGALEDFLANERRLFMVSTADVMRMVDADPALAAADADLPAIARRFRRAHGATHVLQASIERGAGNLRLRYRIADGDRELRRRTLVGADAPALMRGLGADLQEQYGSTDIDAAGELDAFASEAYLRARAARLLGDGEQARALLAVVLKAHPDAFWPRYELAMLDRAERRYDVAERELVALRQRAITRNLPVERFQSTNSLGILYWLQQRHDEALPLFDECLALADERNEPHWRARVMQNLGAVASQRGRFDEARRWWTQAADAYAQAGFELPPAGMLVNLASAESRQGDLASAEHHLQRALRAFEAQGDRGGQATVLDSLHVLRRDQGRYDEAVAYLTQSLAHTRDRTGGAPMLAAGLALLAEVELLRGRTDDARAHLHEAMALLEDAGDAVFARGMVEQRLAQWHLRVGQPGRAEPLLRQAVERFAAAGNPRFALSAEGLLAEAAYARGDVESARARAEAALARTTEVPRPEVAASAHALLARIAATDDPVRAADHWAHAVELADRELAGQPYRRAELLAELGLARLALADPAGARAAMERLDALGGPPHPRAEALRAALAAAPDDAQVADS